jgi:hypothetical protein
MFKLESEILLPDPRFAALRTVKASGVSAVNVADHYRHAERISIIPTAPLEVRASFDRARNVFLYAWFCYELLVVSELQAFGALELALKLKVFSGSQRASSLGRLFRTARQNGLLPPPKTDAIDHLDALLLMRNSLAHGTFEIHTPDMSLTVLSGCAEVINQLYAAPDD